VRQTRLQRLGAIETVAATPSGSVTVRFDTSTL